MIDTHAHIYEPEFDDDRDLVVARAQAAGVRRLLLPAIDSQSDERLFDCCRRWGDYVVPMMGLHPTSVNDNPLWREELARVERYLDSPPAGVGRFCAVGEVGLDLYWSRAWQAEQEECFVAQVELALRHNLPLVIHTREAWGEMCDIIERYRGRGLRGVFHAFSADVACYERLCAAGEFMFGVGGVVTFKKSTLPAVVERMPLERILLETDCPYLTPAPHRGKRNEPAYLEHIAARIAALHNTSTEEVARRTSAAACRLFGL